MKYLVTEEIESPNKVTKHILVADFFFVGGYVALAVAFRSLVHPDLHVAYMLFSIFFAVFLTCKSAFNRKRRNYESLALMLMHDMNIYHGVYEMEDTTDEEEQEG